ncbi:unnamed protein product [Camellia sinensis]
MIHLRGFGTLRLLQSEFGDSSRIAISKFDFEHSSVIYLRGFGTLRLLRLKNDLVKYFREDLRSRNNRTRIECVDLVGFLIDNHGAEIVGQLKSLQLVASLTAERDGEIRKAALNTLATGYKIFGDDIWRYVGKLTEAQRSVLDVDLNGRLARDKDKKNEGKPGEARAVLGILLGKMGDAIVSWVQRNTGPGISYEAQRNGLSKISGCLHKSSSGRGFSWKGEQLEDNLLGKFTRTLGEKLLADMRGMVAPGGVVLGPSILGQSEEFAKAVFPLRSVMVIETMANVGLLYFLFLIRVEMDLTVIHRTGRKALAIAIGGMTLPFIIGTSKKTQATVILFLGVALSVTAFPVLPRILAELKLLSSNIARIAMASALINDVCAWILLANVIALAENDTTSMAALWVIVSSVAFVVCSIFLVRPLVTWMMKRTPEGEAINEFYVCLILTGVMVAGFITDAIGTHSVFGAFMFGLVISNGQLSVTLVETLEDFVSGLFLPLFFAMSGLKTNVLAITGAITWGYLILVIVLAFLGKIAGTLVVAMYYQMPFYEAFTLGLLMNTKGLVEMIVLNVGREQQVLDDRAFAIMIIVVVAMTAIITPIVTTIYKPSKRFAPYKQRSIQIFKPEAELRVLVCIHTPRNVPTIIKLLEASHPTKTSSMLIVHSTQGSGSPALNWTQAQSNQIINAFENFKQRVTCVSVNPLTAISPYTMMHEDICNLAEDKHVAFIIIPFHKQQTVDGGMQVANAVFRSINHNMLANTPCSVGILVDRGLTGSTHVSHQVVVMFFGGADDREPLSYAWRMSEHPRISLTVMRFIAGDNAIDPTRVETSAEPNSPTTLTVVTDKNVVNNGEDTMAAIRSIDNTLYDLFIVGRGQGMVSPLTAGLTDWSECPELGAIGDLLASSGFAATMSVLVVQQYLGNGHGEGLEMPNSPIQHHEQYNNFSSHRPRAQALFYE